MTSPGSSPTTLRAYSVCGIRRASRGGWRVKVRTIWLLHARGTEEKVEVLNEPALYKALIRYGHPEYRTVASWLADEVIPLLRDQGRTDPQRPRRVAMGWRSKRVAVLDWQGRLWVPWDEVPTFSRITPGLGGLLGKLRKETDRD